MKRNRKRSKFQQSLRSKERTKMPPQLIQSPEQQAQMENQRRQMIAQKKFDLACDIYVAKLAQVLTETDSEEYARAALHAADVMFVEAGIIQIEKTNETSD